MKQYLAATLATLVSLRADAPTTPAPTPSAPSPQVWTVLKTWIHIVGCPETLGKHRGAEHLILVFSNGDAIVMDISKVDNTKRHDIEIFVGDVRGREIKYDCGAQS